MNILKRSVCFFLVLSFIGVALVGCGNNNGGGDGQSTADQNSGNNSGSTETETNIYGEPSFTTPNTYDGLDFEGEQITVIIRNIEVNAREWGKETTEDELDEAVLMRNAAVEEALNVTMVQELVPDNPDSLAYANAFNKLIIDDIINDFHYYDIAANYAYYGAYPSVRDYAANLADQDEFPYFDFSLPCWNQAIVNNTTMRGRLHYVSGDVNLTLFDCAMVMWYNKTLYDEKKEDMDPDNMQEYALSGNWTYEELYRWANIYDDSNGVAGKQSDDTYGYSQAGYSVCPNDAYPYAFDLELLITNPDGTHEYNIVGNNKLEDAFTKVQNLINANGNCTDPNINNFVAGHYVFYPSIIYPGKGGNMLIREMEDTYGLLPMPKYDKEQEQYGTTTQDYYTLMSVIDHSESTVPTKGAAVSAFLQLMTEESYTSVRGYYFNRIIKPKYFGTDDSEGTVTNSIALFDIIVANIEFEYWTIYSAQLNHTAWLWRTALNDGASSVEEKYLAEEAAYKKAIVETDIWLGLRNE